MTRAKIVHKRARGAHLFLLELSADATVLGKAEDKEAARMQALENLSELVAQLQNA